MSAELPLYYCGLTPKSPKISVRQSSLKKLSSMLRTAETVVQASLNPILARSSSISTCIRLLLPCDDELRM